jgi:pimeloyl-ACP methyl ester carboxylesterase
MSAFTTADGTEIFYKDWGSGQPVVFSHGWPLNADAWDGQLRLVAEKCSSPPSTAALIRIDRRLTSTPLGGTRTSRLEALILTA